MTDYIYLILAVVGLIFPTNIYLLWVKNTVANGKWPTSYSNTYSLWYPHEHRQHIFTAWTAFEVAFLIPGMMHYSDTYLQLCLSAIGLISLVFVGLFPSSISKDITKIHCIFAKICAVFSMLWLLLKGIYTPTLVFLIGGFIWSRGWQKKYETLIMEYMAFLSAGAGVIICAAKVLGWI